MRFFLFMLILNVCFKMAVAQDSLSVATTTTGIASFYAKKFNGRRTASGQKFNQDSLTAAHKTLTFGTYVLVRNLKNDSTVIVRINDRLPKKSKRSIDLSYKAAQQLNFIKAGLTKVEITPLDTLKR